MLAKGVAAMRYLFPVAMLFVLGCADQGRVATAVATSIPTVPIEMSEADRTMAKLFPPKKTYTRAEFKTLAIGKNQDQIVEAIGKPYNNSTVTWTYRQVTKEPGAEKADVLVYIRWTDGKVDLVTWEE